MITNHMSRLNEQLKWLLILKKNLSKHELGIKVDQMRN